MYELPIYKETYEPRNALIVINFTFYTLIENLLRVNGVNIIL